MTELQAVHGLVARIVGQVADLAETFGELRILLPDPERWCAPWLADDGEVYCPGGVKLARSPDSRKDSSKKEWMHPLPADVKAWSWNPKLNGGAGDWVPAKWHNVYESQARRQPPPEGERPWPGRYDERADS